MKILGITNLFPDRSRPGLAPFNRQQLNHLAGMNDLRLIVPVPWPHRLRAALSGKKIEPPSGCQEGMTVNYPTYFYTPLVLRNLYGRFYFHSIRTLFRRVVREFSPDLVYATWAYPDCYAASLLARQYGLPLVSRVHGSDINRLFRYRGRRKMILEGLNYSEAVISVSRPLKRKLVEYGVEDEKVKVVLNGIDRDLFRRSSRDEAREVTGISAGAEVILFAGNLRKGKGASLLVEAFRRLERPEAQLHIIGEGPERSRLE
ncbi:MAG: glycosyltransferase, partial [Candidatus Latescibacteria bacterium]|nr:glycosyltransferase [bacterium]MBD3423373.1 glycosyltransferase [Candidatus Latescibacterota bacterium]